MKNKFAADTMAIIRRLEKRMLPQNIKLIFEEIEKGKSELIIPAMALAEIGYLSEKEKIETNLQEVKTYIAKHSSVTIVPITHEIIEETFRIDDIPELHDRIIAATAKHLGIELITNDPIIIASKYLKTLW